MLERTCDRSTSRGHLRIRCPNSLLVVPRAGTQRKKNRWWLRVFTFARTTEDIDVVQLIPNRSLKRLDIRDFIFEACSGLLRASQSIGVGPLLRYRSRAAGHVATSRFRNTVNTTRPVACPVSWSTWVYMDVTGAEPADLRPHKSRACYLLFTHAARKTTSDSTARRH
jgi:hypothetical protein